MVQQTFDKCLLIVRFYLGGQMTLVKYIQKDAIQHCIDLYDWKQNSDFWLSSKFLTKKEKEDLKEFYRFWIKFKLI